ncbi:MAG: hypothetical protein RL266_60 [Bacteroidota bacterium]|jgi:MFS superfamily sulfate permease-like transporter
MRLFSNGLKGWTQSWKGDLRASISVAFIAIPLGLGIGLASGVPPLAAVIPSVVGGLLFAWFSGGNITVHSTPKMLIGVTAAAILTLGGDDLLLGYRLFLAAVFVAGIIQFILGLMRLGIIGDLIPATVIKSLLASVGIIIIVKQIPVLVGSQLHPNNLIELMQCTVEIVKDANPIVVSIGLASVLIMFLHSYIEMPVIKAIPGAVWVILVSIGYSYGLGFADGGQLLGFEYGPDMLIDLPSKITEAVVLPDFSIWKTAIFWNVVLAIVLISSIEGILSAKAIDRLDPLKRKSNVNRELRVVGLATSVSGLIGGLPVIPGIVPSAVSVSHNGRSQMVDVFQAILILGLVVMLGSQLQHIPLAALAGVLIHTGYKLVNPTEIRNIFNIGWDELLVFLATLGVTLASDLIIGIAAGVMLTLTFQVIRLRSVVKLFTILFRPNVVSYGEDEDNSFLIGVKGYSNFLNYPQLKKALDVIPSNAKIIIDLSLAEFIDHTVLEHLAQHEENQIRRGGDFEIIGMDTHLSSAKHPLSMRFKGSNMRITGPNALTSRQHKLQSVASEMGHTFDPSVILFVKDFEAFHLLRHKKVDRVYNRFAGSAHGFRFTVEDVDIHEGELQTKVVGQVTVALIEVPSRIPLFTLEKEYFFDKLAALAGYDDIDFQNFQDFSSNFRLKGENEQEVREFFTASIIQFLDANLLYRIESSGEQLLIFGKQRLLSVTEFIELIGFCKKLIRVMTTDSE